MAETPKPNEAQPEDGKATSVSLQNWGGENIDMQTFEQILEMDEEDDREFSRSIALGFFEQAAATFIDMDEALEAKNLPKLSSLGHFLKGSSATIGLTKVKDSCEKIQHYGADEKDEDKCLEMIQNTLVSLKKDYAQAERVLKEFLGLVPPSSANVTDATAAGDESTKVTTKPTVAKDTGSSNDVVEPEAVKAAAVSSDAQVAETAASTPAASTPAAPSETESKDADAAAIATAEKS